MAQKPGTHFGLRSMRQLAPPRDHRTQKFENITAQIYWRLLPTISTSKFSNECRNKLPIMSLVSGEKVR